MSVTRDDELVQQMADEILGLDGPLTLELDPRDLLPLVGLVQLATRHPELPPSMREVADQVLRVVRKLCADCPALLDAIRRGDDPRFDSVRRRP